MSQCHRYNRQLADYVVGGLRGRRLARLEDHLTACSSCRQEVAALQRTGELLTSQLLHPAPARVWEGVSQQLRQRAAYVTRPLRWVWGVAAVCLVLGIAMAFTLVRTPIAAPPVPVAMSEGDVEMEGLFAERAATTWDTPLADDAALGLQLAVVEGSG